MSTYVLATANADKVGEIRQILAPLHLTLLDRPSDVPDVEEDGDTLEDNALIKARSLTEATGLAAIADDTGLFVTALGGAPGVHSARYAGLSASYEDNVNKLLRELSLIDDASREAVFRTVAAVSYPDGSWFVVDGELAGTISYEARGHQGFGYDPVFVPDDARKRTLAELTPEEKNALSHRGSAFRALVSALEDR